MDIFSILQSGYAPVSSQSFFPLGSKFANVDPKQWEGTWTGIDVHKQSFTVRISGVHGYRATAVLQTSAGLKTQRVFITTKNTFRIGDSSFTRQPDGKGKLVTIVTDPNTGKQTADTAFATQNS
jgi:hypothetical protein